MKTSDVIAVVVDYGYFLHVAARLAQDYKKVYYAPPWHCYNPTLDKYSVGKGLESLGIIHVDSFEDVVDECNLLVFPDVGDADKQRYWRKHGKLVFGAGDSEELEQDRQAFKKMLASRDLPCPKYRVVKGIDAMVKALKTEDDLWIKIDSRFRGMKESWHHDKWSTSIQTVDELAHCLGGMRDSFPFLLESPWPGVESGSDFFLSAGQYLPVGMWGWEQKNEAYTCKFIDMADMPGPIKKVNTAMLPVWKKYDVRGACSNEVRVNDKGIGYYNDATQRFGSPPSEIISAGYKNFSDIVLKCAMGEQVKPEPVAPYAAQVVINTRCANEWLPVDISDKDMKDLKIRRLCQIDDQKYIIPLNDDCIVGSAVGFGKDRFEAEQQAMENADKFKVKDSYYSKAAFDELDGTIGKGKKVGLEGF